MCHALMFRDFSVQHSWNCMEGCHHLICHFHLILSLTCRLCEDFSVEINSLSSPDHLMPKSNLHLSQCLSVSPLDIKAFESGLCYLHLSTVCGMDQTQGNSERADKANSGSRLHCWLQTPPLTHHIT